MPPESEVAAFASRFRMERRFVAVKGHRAATIGETVHSFIFAILVVDCVGGLARTQILSMFNG